MRESNHSAGLENFKILFVHRSLVTLRDDDLRNWS